MSKVPGAHGAVALCFAMLFLATEGTHAAELTVSELGVVDSEVRVRLELRDPLDSRTRGAVASGLPITVRFTAELWRERRRWFDQHVATHVEAFRVRWDPRERVYTLGHPGPGRRIDSYERLDELLLDLSAHEVFVHPRELLDERARYFVAVEVAVRPLTLEQFRELEGWIGGRISGSDDPSDPEAGEGSEGVPGAVLGFLLDISGFGDLVLRQRSPSFRPSDLPPLSLEDAGS
jgi:hypothetical protein